MKTFLQSAIDLFESTSPSDSIATPSITDPTQWGLLGYGGVYTELRLGDSFSLMPSSTRSAQVYFLLLIAAIEGEL